MKKGREYVTSGSVDASTTEFFVADENPVVGRLTSRSHPADLPRDYGMAGATGAYEVPALSDFVQSGLQELLDQLPSADPLAEMNLLLDRLLPTQERKRVVVESFSNKVLTLGLRRRADRFLFSRTLVPRLQAELFAMYGRISVHFTDR
ncbi:MAG: hypothetical protein Q4C03_00185 [bacterium]|nr:hypothetical protein [bacterium]